MKKNLTLLFFSILFVSTGYSQTCPTRAEFFGNRLFLKFATEAEADYFYDGFSSGGGDNTDCMAGDPNCNNLASLMVNGSIVDDAGVVEGPLVMTYLPASFRDQNSTSIRFEGLVANSSGDNFQGTVTLNLVGGGALTCLYDAAGDLTMALPVDLVDFKATQTNQTVQLDWQTASEFNNEGFEIQRSVDGERWSVLEFMAGKGTTQDLNSYQCFDKYPTNGVNYYRLKQIDFDGQFEYSDIKTVTVTSEKPVTIRPSVVQHEIQVSLNSDLQDNANYRVLNYAGQEMQAGLLQAGASNIQVDGLSSGMYLLQVNSRGVNTVLKFVKL